VDRVMHFVQQIDQHLVLFIDLLDTDTQLYYSLNSREFWNQNENCCV
jgi:hypothetical protein